MLDTLLTGPIWARFSEKLECYVNEAAVLCVLRLYISMVLMGEVGYNANITSILAQTDVSFSYISKKRAYLWLLFFLKKNYVIFLSNNLYIFFINRSKSPFH